MRYSNGFLTCLLAMTLTLLASCATTGGDTVPAAETPRAKSATGPSPQHEGATAEDAGAERLRRGLAESSRAPGSWTAMRLAVECQDEGGMRSLEVFDNGVAIWNNSRQFELPLTDVAHLLGLLEQADFPGFAPVYGGKKKAPPTGASATMVTCRIQFELDGVKKESVQLYKGKQSAAMKALADSILEYCRNVGEAGLATADLQDGLEKLAAGQLAPEALTVMLHRKPARRSEGADGFLFRLAGPRVTTRAFEPGQGYGDTLAIELGSAEVEDLAQSLADASPGELPANLWADDYTDLSIQVLNHRKSVQARQFARLSPSTHGQRQVNFDSVYGMLRDLHRRTLDDGRPSVED